MHIPILRMAEKGGITRLKKRSYFANKTYFQRLISNMKVTCMPLASFVFSVFDVNPFFLVLRSWHTYAHSHPGIGSKGTHYLLKNSHILLRKVLLKLDFQDESHLYPNCLFYILSLCLKCFLFQFFSRDISILTRVQKGHIRS